MASDVLDGSDLRVHTEILAESILVSLAGDIDVTSTPHLDHEMKNNITAGISQVVLDVSHVGFMGSAALTFMLRWSKELRANGIDFVVRSPSPMALKIFAICGLTDVLTIEQDRQTTQ